MTRIRWDRLAVMAALAAFWGGVIQLILLLAGCEQETGGSILTPPERYQGDTSAAVHFGDRYEIERICTERVGRYAMACADVGGPGIWIENPCDVADQHWYPALLCHEVAHRNMWPADHRR